MVLAAVYHFSVFLQQYNVESADILQKLQTINSETKEKIVQHDVNLN